MMQNKFRGISNLYIQIGTGPKKPGQILKTHPDPTIFCYPDPTKEPGFGTPTLVATIPLKGLILCISIPAWDFSCRQTNSNCNMKLYIFTL